MLSSPINNILSLLVALVFSLPCKALVVLQYHHVSDKTPRSTSISPALFKQHMRYLEEHQFSVLSTDQIRSMLNKGVLPDKAVMITFDDGYRSVYEFAYPLLKKKKWPFTLFINTRAHDQKNPRYIQWDELREMSKNKVIIANHSDSHPHMIRRRPQESIKEWNTRRLKEIKFAEQRIKKRIGTSHKIFAYPYGEYDHQLTSLLSQHGYIAFGQQSGPVAKQTSAQLIPRFPFGGKHVGIEDFAIKVYSLAFPLLETSLSDARKRTMENPEIPSGGGIPVMKLKSPIFQFEKNITCYASGQGQAEVKWKGKIISVQAKRQLSPGRSRYNCTALANRGRFYWHSQLLIQRNGDGTWYAE